MTDFIMNSVKVAARLKVTDEKEVNSTSSTDALSLLFEQTKDDVNISSTCAYDWREPFVELEYDSLAEANERYASDFAYLTNVIRELYSEQEERRKEHDALQETYDGLDQILCDIHNGKNKQHNELEIDGAMGILMTKMTELNPIGAAW